MTQKHRAFLLLLVPALLVPIGRLLARRDDPDLLLGLSSSFWGGWMLGVSICSALVAAYMFGQSSRQT